jgi:hypothetical protein
MSPVLDRGLDRQRSSLDLARARVEEAARECRRARFVGGRGAPGALRASLVELVRRRAALSTELERFGALACPTLADAAPLALAFRAAREALEIADLLAKESKLRRRLAPRGMKALSATPL